VIGLLATDAVDLAVRHLEHALAEARARASIPAVAFLTAHRGWFYLRGGAVAEAEADARAALELLSAHAIQLGRRFALALLVEASLENGQVVMRGVEEALGRPPRDFSDFVRNTVAGGTWNGAP
jgi:hypothetical protein